MLSSSYSLVGEKRPRDLDGCFLQANQENGNGGGSVRDRE